MIAHRTRLCLLLSALAALSAPSLAQDALALLHKMQDALGGADKIAAIRDYDETVSGATWNSAGAPIPDTPRKRVRWIRPNILRLDQTGRGNTYVLYFDGTSGWEILPNGTYTALEGTELEFARGYLRGFDLNVWLADRDPQRSITSPAPNVIEIADNANSGKKIQFTLDPATGLPVKSTTISISETGQPIAQEMQLGQWLRIDGILFPHHNLNFHDGVKRAEITVDSLKINSNLNPADLALKPANQAPVMSGPR